MKRLPKAQHEMIRIWVLGGFDAVGHHSTKTVDTLISKDYLDFTGPTDKAREYVDACEREDLAKIGSA